MWSAQKNELNASELEGDEEQKARSRPVEQEHVENQSKKEEEEAEISFHTYLPHLSLECSAVALENRRRIARAGRGISDNAAAGVAGILLREKMPRYPPIRQAIDDIWEASPS